MPPKKDKGKEKKADAGEIDPAAIAKAFELQIEVLQRQLGASRRGTGNGGGGAGVVPATNSLALTPSAPTPQPNAAERTERALGAERVANELRAKMRLMEGDMLANEKNTFDITAEMTRQYKAMQENLMGKIGVLETEIHRLKDDLAAARTLLAETIREKDAVIARRDEEIERMKVKMEDMAAEFGDMLAETLRKMGERVELSAATWEGEATSGVPIIRRMEEFAASAAKA